MIAVLKDNVSGCCDLGCAIENNDVIMIREYKTSCYLNTMISMLQEYDVIMLLE